MDESIIRKIDELVNVGVKDTYEMRRHLSVHVTREIFSKENIQPDPSNRRFYPKLSDIRSHMYCASIKNRFSKIDQENVTEQLKQWKASNPGDFFYFRPHGDVTIKLVRERDTLKTMKQTNSFSYTKLNGSAGSYRDTEMKCACLMQPTRPHAMLYHYFSLWFTRMWIAR